MRQKKKEKEKDEGSHTHTDSNSDNNSDIPRKGPSRSKKIMIKRRPPSPYHEPTDSRFPVPSEQKETMHYPNQFVFTGVEKSVTIAIKHNNNHDHGCTRIFKVECHGT